MVSFGVSDNKQPFPGGFRRGRVIGLFDWPPPLAVICLTQHQTQSKWRAHPRYDKGCQRARARMVSAWGAISQQAGRVVSSRAPSGFLPMLLSWSARWVHEIMMRPYSSRICPSASSALKSVDGAAIRAPTSSGWICGRTSLPAQSYRMEGEGEPPVQAVQSHICIAIGSLATAADWFISFTLHEPITCSYNCVIEKGFIEGEKRDFPILTSI